MTGLTRRRLLATGLGTAAVAAAGAAGLELIEHGVLPGKTDLAQLDGACEVASPPLVFGRLGQARSGRFYSQARRREVGYTIAWPPGSGLLDVEADLRGGFSGLDSSLSGATGGGAAETIVIITISQGTCAFSASLSLFDSPRATTSSGLARKG